MTPHIAGSKQSVLFGLVSRCVLRHHEGAEGACGRRGRAGLGGGAHCGRLAAHDRLTSAAFGAPGECARVHLCFGARHQLKHNVHVDNSQWQMDHMQAMGHAAECGRRSLRRHHEGIGALASLRLDRAYLASRYVA